MPFTPKTHRVPVDPGRRVVRQAGFSPSVLKAKGGGAVTKGDQVLLYPFLNVQFSVGDKEVYTDELGEHEGYEVLMHYQANAETGSVAWIVSHLPFEQEPLVTDFTAAYQAGHYNNGRQGVDLVLNPDDPFQITETAYVRIIAFKEEDCEGINSDIYEYAVPLTDFPIIAPNQYQLEDKGYLDLHILDPKQRITTVEYRVAEGRNLKDEVGDPFLPAPEPTVDEITGEKTYQTIVTLSEKHNSFIEYRINFNTNYPEWREIFSFDADVKAEVDNATLDVMPGGDVRLWFTVDEDTTSVEIRESLNGSTFTLHGTVDTSGENPNEWSGTVHTGLGSGTYYCELTPYNGETPGKIWRGQTSRDLSQQDVPSFSFEPYQVGSTGYVDVTVYDSANLVTRVNFFRKSGTSAEVSAGSDSTGPFDGEKYTKSVELVEGHTSTIRWDIIWARGIVSGFWVFDFDSTPEIIDGIISADANGNAYFRCRGDEDVKSMRIKYEVNDATPDNILDYNAREYEGNLNGTIVPANGTLYIEVTPYSGANLTGIAGPTWKGRYSRGTSIMAPVVEEHTRQSGATGYLDLTVHDPHGLATSLRFYTKPGNNPAADFGSLTTVSSPSNGQTYTRSVALFKKHDSFIKYELDYVYNGATYTIAGIVSFDYDRYAEIVNADIRVDPSNGYAYIYAKGDEDTASIRVYYELNDSTPDAYNFIENDNEIAERRIGTIVVGPNDVLYVKVIPRNSAGTEGEAWNLFARRDAVNVVGTDGFIDKDYLIDASKQFGTMGEFTETPTYANDHPYYRLYLWWTGGVIKFPDGNSVTTSEGDVYIPEKVYIYVDTVTGAIETTTDWETSINSTRVLLAVAKPGYSYTHPTTGLTRYVAPTFVSSVGVLGLSGEHLRPSCITTNHIAVNSIRAAHIVVNKLDALAADLGTMYAGQILVGNAGSGAASETINTSSFTGIRIWKPSASTARLASYNAGTIQVQIDTDGRLYAGAGAVKLDEKGLTIASGLDDINKIKIGDAEIHASGTMFIYGGTNNTISFHSTFGSYPYIRDTWYGIPSFAPGGSPTTARIWTNTVALFAERDINGNIRLGFKQSNGTIRWIQTS